MDEGELWVGSEQDGEIMASDERTADPKRFTLGLTYQGEQGDFHVRNRPGQVQRRLAFDSYGGSRKSPSFTITCEAKAIIHGKMGPRSAKRGTLLVYEFKFNSYRGARIKEADISFQFRAAKDGDRRPSVHQIRPDGLHKMEETTQPEARGLSASLNIPPGDGVLAVSGETSIEKVTKHFTQVNGNEFPADPFGNFHQARFFLSENKSQGSGIPSKFLACMLLERQDNKDFICIPRAKATPDLRTMVTSLFSRRGQDDPIIFRVTEPPFNELEGVAEIDRNNLAAVDLDGLWYCTAYSLYGQAIEPSKSGKSAEYRGSN
ncbi:hypothetical protein V8C44DRAFT_324937 [Trichoderma aethiopicum]